MTVQLQGHITDTSYIIETQPCGHYNCGSSGCDDDYYIVCIRCHNSHRILDDGVRGMALYPDIKICDDCADNPEWYS